MAPPSFAGPTFVVRRGQNTSLYDVYHTRSRWIATLVTPRARQRALASPSVGDQSVRACARRTSPRGVRVEARGQLGDELQQPRALRRHRGDTGRQPALPLGGEAQVD